MAADKQLKVKVLTPSKPLLEKRVTHVNVPGKLGYIGILPGHAPMIAELSEGVVKIEGGELGAPQAYTIHDGYVQVENDEVSILVDDAKAVTLN